MDKNENVFIKLQIEKSKKSGNLMITINFDKQAPNFSIDNETISWTPTFEELDFIIETSEIISKRKNQDNEVVTDIPSSQPPDVKVDEPDEEVSEKNISTFEPLREDLEVIRESPEIHSEQGDEKKLFIQVDGKTIDEALKRKGVDVGEAFIVDEDDKGILDKMLKKRGKDKEKS